MNRRFLFALLLLILPAPSTFAQDAAKTPADVVAGAVKAAEAFLATLDRSQQEKLLFPFDDDVQRKRWSNLPSGIVKRAGLRMGDLSDKQKEAVMGLLKATLSPRGVEQIVENMNGDEVLKQRGGGRPQFGRAEYFVSILGKPSATEPWMWQFGGHHLGVNATIVRDRITLSPTLTGGQPVKYAFEGRSVVQLAREQDKMFELIGALSESDLKQVVLGGHHDDMRFGPGREGAKPKEEGIKASALGEKPKQLLLELIGERIGILNDVHAKAEMDTIVRNLDRTWFSWHGPTKKGAAASFRVQGPTVLIEYSPQHLGGDATQHTHAMYRDPTNDYGAAMLKKN
jgi:hypothetical protein